MKIRENWREQLTALITADGRERATLSRAAKLNVAYLRDILDRDQTPLLRSAEKLSDALGVSIEDWFLEASPRETSAGPDPAIQTHIMPRNIPVYGSAAGSEDGAFEFNTGEPIDFVRRPPRLENIKDAYAVYVSGDSVSPWREDGQLVYVHPNKKPKIGDYVVLQMAPRRDGEAPLAYVKRLEKRTPNEVVVRQYNPPKLLTFASAKVVSVHPILDWSELLGI